MRILGLDLSLTATGMCRVGGVLGTFVPRSRGDSRLDEIAAAVRDWCAADDIELVVMEDLLFGGKAAAVMGGPLGMVHGAVRLQLIRKRLPYVVVPPASLKKYATGRGNATKPDMRVAWLQRARDDVRDDNQVDAAWLQAMALDWYGSPLFPVPTAQREAMQKVRWLTRAGAGVVA